MTEAVANLRFQRRPSPVLPEHRPLYKIAQIALVLHLASRAGRSSLARLHLFNWAFKAPERAARLIKAVKTKKLDVSAWGFDPALAIALRYACAEGLIVLSNGGYELTDMGLLFARSIIEDQLMLDTEKEFLKNTGKGITETMVDIVAKGWEAE
ncbi:hypothetical protein [Metapseudomonas otitidis]|uniref:hypothetical protein n=1 Tax=Metapseudomonas otitidis TaxID=319939 RepID=UPI00244A53B7|nr:hypothetical protein [Pseudomonas otitidis]MDH0334928.1 hypothetical protein [Pseudomonas otitidis]